MNSGLFDILLFVSCLGTSIVIGVLLAGMPTGMSRPRGPFPFNRAFAFSITCFALLSIGLGASGKRQQLKEALVPGERLRHMTDLWTMVLSRDSRFRDATVKMSPAERAKFPGTLAARGTRRLPLKDLNEWNALRAIITERAPAVCSAMGGAQTDDRVTSRELEALPRDILARWFTLRARAARMELDDAPYPVSGHPAEDLELLLGTVSSHLSQDDQFRLSALRRSNASPSPEDACWLVKTISNALTTLVLDNSTKERLLQTWALTESEGIR